VKIKTCISCHFWGGG